MKNKTVIEKIYNLIRLFANFRREPYLQYRKILGFYPYNPKLYQRALRHKSVVRSHKQKDKTHNERLEYLGDAVLGAIVSDILFHRFGERSEGFLSNMRSRIVNRKSLNRLAMEVGIAPLVLVSPRTTNIARTSIYGNAFEAFVGAIYLDRGYDKCRQFVEQRVINRLLDMESIAHSEENFKSRLLEYCQKHKIELHFELQEEDTASGNRHQFTCCLYLNNRAVAIATGLSKRESQQKAAYIALQKINDNWTPE
ncbi:MAG: ribonuclease III [Prevotellaceae bacterium]|nr:ribonuclease III [Prevotellaceae bacterium]